ncbi:hypothetical protein E3N88_43090 [Mikania micrantha]|uniref:Uncharacterized protein n=1 Tax=Mikania micrantha TaxID=192012 RepID=A0A5N6LFX0_9ASTR|nr:hypothetical protein E3N88_43090 [Mikania micrantha]
MVQGLQLSKRNRTNLLSILDGKKVKTLTIMGKALRVKMSTESAVLLTYDSANEDQTVDRFQTLDEGETLHEFQLLTKALDEEKSLIEKEFAVNEGAWPKGAEFGCKFCTFIILSKLDKPGQHRKIEVAILTCFKVKKGYIGLYFGSDRSDEYGAGHMKCHEQGWEKFGMQIQSVGPF